VLMLHQCGKNGTTWAVVGSTLSAKGIHALAFDYRPPPITDQQFAADVDVAFAYLKAQPGVDPKRIAVAGASCGVNNGITLAARSNQIKALLLLSGPNPPDGLDYLRAHPEMPIFAITSSAEGESVTATRAVVAASTNRATMLRLVDRPGHGTPLLDLEPGLFDAAIAWLMAALK
jgi:hypothetical protein